MTYAYTRQIQGSFDDAVDRVRQALSAEGFGIISTIDVRAAMREKLGVERGNYIILGACNPAFAHQALEMDPSIGLLLPCNVTVYEDGDVVTVSTILPSALLSIVDRPEFLEFATAIEHKLRSAVDRV